MANIPPYVLSLLHDLEQSPSPEQSLIRFSPYILRDITLANVYTSLGFNSEKVTFTGAVQREQAATTIREEYQVVTDPVTPLKICIPTEAVRRFGAGNGEDEEENEFFTPVNKRELCLTPRPARNHHSVSTRASRVITPSSVTSVSDDESDFDPIKSSRGLKSLTIQVKHLLSTHHKISYQEVASLLSKEAVSASGSERTREEKNIKRRVYDAINVLIAAGVLDKDDKGVFARNAGEQCDADISEEAVEDRRSRVREKREELGQLLNRFLAVQHLLHRNAQSKEEGERLQFPFLVLGTEDSEENAVSIRQVNVVTNEGCTNLLLKFRKPVAMLGDLEVLLHLNLHRMSLQMLTHLLPHRELFKYVDAPYLRS